MKNGANSNGRIEALKERERKLRLAIANEHEKQEKRERRETAKLQSLIGIAVLRRLYPLKDDNIPVTPQEAEALNLMLKDMLQTTSSAMSESDRKLLRAKRLL